MRAPATATTLATRNEAVMPLMNVAWVTSAIVAVFGGLVSLATKDWRARGGGSVASMLAAFDAYADQVTPALAGHWR
jgi:hypothetical protein